MSERADAVDIAVIGAGAAGLFAATWAARTRPGARVIALDGARKLGAKILVAGGGRCNVTHFEVSERDFAGSTPVSIRRVLSRFGVDRVVTFFRELGVELKREETGKLFPITDDAHTILDALLAAARDAGVSLRHPARVRAIKRCEEGFAIRTDGEGGAEGAVTAGHPRGPDLTAAKVILAMGGQALPKSGSDGAGYEIARSLGHSLTPLITPALVPLLLPRDHWLCSLSGLSAPAEVRLRSGSGGAGGAGGSGAGGRVEARFTGSVLCTHFGLSGPAILDISRHLIHAQSHDPTATLEINWLPGMDLAAVDSWLKAAKGRTLLSLLREKLPERLARAILAATQVDPALTVQQTPRESRRSLSRALVELPLPVTGSRGYTFAEATAGGIPLSEFRLETLESRIVPGLHACGEILDVDGRIGGFNFQWAWASGFVAGAGAASR